MFQDGEEAEYETERNVADRAVDFDRVMLCDRTTNGSGRLFETEDDLDSQTDLGREEREAIVEESRTMGDMSLVVSRKLKGHKQCSNDVRPIRETGTNLNLYRMNVKTSTPAGQRLECRPWTHRYGIDSAVAGTSR